MTTPGIDGPRDEGRFDESLRAAHAEAVANISTRTRVKLGRRLRAATAAPAARTHRPAWGFALACATALVVVVGVHQRPATPPARGTPPVVADERGGDNGDLVASLDETPDLYLWLASRDANGLVSE